MTHAAPATVDDAIRLALSAYEDLQGVAEEVEDEWTYIQDLTAAHRERLEAVAAGEGAAPLEPAVAAAIVAACAEVGRIEDPHRAIDWLSTFPSVIAVVLGREP